MAFSEAVRTSASGLFSLHSSKIAVSTVHTLAHSHTHIHNATFRVSCDGRWWYDALAQRQQSWHSLTSSGYSSVFTSVGKIQRHCYSNDHKTTSEICQNYTFFSPSLNQSVPDIFFWFWNTPARNSFKSENWRSKNSRRQPFLRILVQLWAAVSQKGRRR